MRNLLLMMGLFFTLTVPVAAQQSKDTSNDEEKYYLNEPKQKLKPPKPKPVGTYNEMVIVNPRLSSNTIKSELTEMMENSGVVQSIVCSKARLKKLDKTDPDRFGFVTYRHESDDLDRPLAKIEKNGRKIITYEKKTEMRELSFTSYKKCAEAKKKIKKGDFTYFALEKGKSSFVKKYIVVNNPGDNQPKLKNFSKKDGKAKNTPKKDAQIKTK